LSFYDWGLGSGNLKPWLPSCGSVLYGWGLDSGDLNSTPRATEGGGLSALTWLWPPLVLAGSWTRLVRVPVGARTRRPWTLSRGGKESEVWPALSAGRQLTEPLLRHSGFSEQISSSHAGSALPSHVERRLRPISPECKSYARGASQQRYLKCMLRTRPGAAADGAARLRTARWLFSSNYRRRPGTWRH
jgi:hypothetical protein